MMNMMRLRARGFRILTKNLETRGRYLDGKKIIGYTKFSNAENAFLTPKNPTQKTNPKT